MGGQRGGRENSIAGQRFDHDGDDEEKKKRIHFFFFFFVAVHSSLTINQKTSQEPEKKKTLTRLKMEKKYREVKKKNI